jgi:pyridinium-3,5-bisthiocarboxylic acid mononucleotide nickel chelatase
MIAIVDPFAGLAGDMFLAALLDAGASLDAVRAAVTSTGLTGWELSAERVVDHGLAATQVHVEVTDTAVERHAAELIALARAARPEPVAQAAVATLSALAAVEAQLHGVDVDTVHLHELGGHDTVVDIVGVCAALHDLGVDRIHVRPLPMGRGTVTTRHGVLPVPAPATAALLRGATVVGSDLPGETVTPTAAALVATLGVRWDEPPPIMLRGTGYGAGSRRLGDRPNVALVRLGTSQDVGRDVESLVELATTVDDVTGETLGYVVDRLLSEGALDAWITPAVMKKSRPGHVVHVLARPGDTAALRAIVLGETGSLGLRFWPVERYALARQTVTVDVDGHAVRIKSGPHGSKPEHDDVATAARELGVPLREIARRAVEAATPR